MSIHTFGDSHSSSGWNFCDNIKTHHLGPILCYSFGIQKLNRCDIRKFKVKDGDSVIFCFGEIDCRCHIQKYITTDKSYKKIIDEIIENYIHAIKINLENSKVKLKNICIFNIPPTAEKHTIPGQDKAKYPLLGTDEERKSYGIYFNKILNDKCKENNWIFFDVYDNYIDNNGYLNKELSDGNVHIKDGSFLKKFIIKHFL